VRASGVDFKPLLLFSVVMYEITEEMQGKVLWCMTFADDKVLIGKI